LRFPTSSHSLVVAAVVLTSVAACAPSRRHAETGCMERVMYFESNRSSRDGMVAVGSVVMNRVKSNDYPDTVCGVVTQKGQFAPHVMSRRIGSRSMPLVEEAATSVMAGERHPLIEDAQFFHAASYRASHNNMHYVLVTGGNAFYEKRPPQLVTQATPPSPLEGITGR
jgi:spore germination cell wall hydrolase CwlJ-like protein